MKVGEKRLGALTSLCFGLLLCVPLVHGQFGVRMVGTVFDPTGAPIDGADVTVFADERVMTSKANQHGAFEFPHLPPDARYVEASSPGFAAMSIAVIDKIPEEVIFILSPGSFSGVTPLCSPPNDRPLPSASYEERHGDAQLTGKVTEVLGMPLADTSLTLSKADLDSRLSTESHRLSMRARKINSMQRVITEIMSNTKGEFQLGKLEPGWYTLQADRDGYSTGYVEFWVARETLTRLSPIYLSNCQQGPVSPVVSTGHR